MRILIVDDERLARKVLREELESIAAVEVVGEAEDGEKALAEIAAKRPDLVFLDVQMPGLGGFETVDRLKSGPMPVIIMLTAYDQYALRAYEAGAIDYLLKPVSPDRLKQAVERATTLRRNPTAVAEHIAHLQEARPASSQAGSGARRIVGKIGEEYFLLNLEEILAFQADGDLVWIVTAKKRYLATQNLKTLEQRLRNSFFRRIHRNALVNINQMRKMSMITSQRWVITLDNGQEFIVSKRQARNVREVLRW
jgi:DNA-binding LytR/AlgR family response regulator